MKTVVQLREATRFLERIDNGVRLSACELHVCGLTQLGELPHFQHVLVEPLIVGDGEDDLVEPLQLLDVVYRHVAQFCPAPENVSHK